MSSRFNPPPGWPPPPGWLDATGRVAARSKMGPASPGLAALGRGPDLGLTNLFQPSDELPGRIQLLQPSGRDSHDIGPGGNQGATGG